MSTRETGRLPVQLQKKHNEDPIRPSLNEWRLPDPVASLSCFLFLFSLARPSVPPAYDDYEVREHVGIRVSIYRTRAL